MVLEFIIIGLRENNCCKTNPRDILLKYPKIDINYCLCWVNETWRKNWYTQEKTILIEKTYGDKEAWKDHFNY